MKSQNTSLGKKLEIKGRYQEEIFNNLSKDLEDEDWNRYFKNLKDNSKHKLQMIEDQNKIVQNTFTEDILKSLEDSHVNKEVLCYGNRVTKLIQEINNKLDDMKDVNGPVAWNKIFLLFTFLFICFIFFFNINKIYCYQYGS